MRLVTTCHTYMFSDRSATGVLADHLAFGMWLELIQGQTCLAGHDDVCRADYCDMACIYPCYSTHDFILFISYRVSASSDTMSSLSLHVT